MSIFFASPVAFRHSSCRMGRPVWCLGSDEPRNLQACRLSARTGSDLAASPIVLCPLGMRPRLRRTPEPSAAMGEGRSSLGPGSTLPESAVEGRDEGTDEIVERRPLLGGH